MSHQNDIEKLKDLMQQNQMTADQANVELVRMERARAVHKLPAAVRKALQNAVKTGQLARLPKKGVAPEVFYHPNFKHMALDIQSEAVNATIRALQAVCV